MRIIHYKKTKGTKTDVPVSLGAALDPKSFATYTKEQDGEVKHVGVAWMLPVDPSADTYEGHRFEILMEPDELDRLLEAITVAKARFAEQKIPGNLATAKEDVKADAEG